MGNRQMLGFAVIGFALLTLLNTAFIVDLRQRGLVRQFREILQTDVAPGLHFKVPFVQDVLVFDGRMLTLDNQTESFLTLEGPTILRNFLALRPHPTSS